MRERNCGVKLITILETYSIGHAEVQVERTWRRLGGKGQNCNDCL
jgi:hypothetical protein